MTRGNGLIDGGIVGRSGGKGGIGGSVGDAVMAVSGGSDAVSIDVDKEVSEDSEEG